MLEFLEGTLIDDFHLLINRLIALTILSDRNIKVSFGEDGYLSPLSLDFNRFLFPRDSILVIVWNNLPYSFSMDCVHIEDKCASFIGFKSLQESLNDKKLSAIVHFNRDEYAQENELVVYESFKKEIAPCARELNIILPS